MGTTQETPAAVSDRLLAAQNRLLELRQAHQAAKAAQTGAHPAVRPSAPPTPTPNTPTPTPYPIATLPAHLGWENPRFTEHLRRALAARQKTGAGMTNCEFRMTNEESSPVTRHPSPVVPGDHHSSFVKVYPDLALALLREKQAAAGRVWLLLRHLDPLGRGWVSVAAATRALTADGAPLRICGRRQLHNLLKQGDGLFWERTDLAGPGRPVGSENVEPRIFLRSVTRVAAALGVPRLGTAPVAVDITALTGSIGQVRAHLFASFHSGRQQHDLVTGRARPRGPIARATMQRLADASPNSQRAYERRAGVQRQASFAIGPQAPAGATQTAEAQETAWRRGRAYFRLTDRHGRFGRPGRTYLAWQLPNEYTGPHARLSRSRMKRMNRALADLLVNGMTGNGERAGGHKPPHRRFFGNAKAAWSAERSGRLGEEAYWRAPDGGWQVWQESPGGGSAGRLVVQSACRRAGGRRSAFPDA